MTRVGPAGRWTREFYCRNDAGGPDRKASRDSLWARVSGSSGSSQASIPGGRRITANTSPSWAGTFLKKEGKGLRPTLPEAEGFAASRDIRRLRSQRAGGRTRTSGRVRGALRSGDERGRRTYDRRLIDATPRLSFAGEGHTFTSRSGARSWPALRPIWRTTRDRVSKKSDGHPSPHLVAPDIAYPFAISTKRVGFCCARSTSGAADHHGLHPRACGRRSQALSYPADFLSQSRSWQAGWGARDARRGRSAVLQTQRRISSPLRDLFEEETGVERRPRYFFLMKRRGLASSWGGGGSMSTLAKSQTDEEPGCSTCRWRTRALSGQFPRGGARWPPALAHILLERAAGVDLAGC
jgi:hypothetical protein